MHLPTRKSYHIALNLHKLDCRNRILVEGGLRMRLRFEETISGKPFIYKSRDSNKHSFVCVYLDGWIYCISGDWVVLAGTCGT